MRLHKILILCGWILFVCSNFQCTKVMVYAKEHPTETSSRRYMMDASSLYEKVKATLKLMDEPLVMDDPLSLKVMTSWKSAEMGAYYLLLFKRKDYSAATGTYRQLVVDLIPQGAYTRVDIHTNIKTLSGKLTSTQVLENKLFKSLEDQLRSPQIEMTNVGVSNR